MSLRRADVLPELDLPVAGDLIDAGRKLAKTHSIGPSPFLSEHGVACEVEYKQAQAAAGRIMFHAQVGYRDAEKSRRAYGEIHREITCAGFQLDRYGICLDWSMGYPAADRRGRPKGTGLILESPEDFQRLTAAAPVAPHFGDFVIGLPGAVDNTIAALAAGATAIGNLGQYFTFRLPHWNDDVATTAATLQALALCAAQPVDVLIHSNLDDGFAALFSDLACSLGAVLLERHIVEGLIGGRMGHCYGHTFSDPVARSAFQGALTEIGGGPGTMIYGNTTAFGPDPKANYDALSAYLRVDFAGQRAAPTGHAINPVPVTEALRIPEMDEIVDAHLFANRLLEDSAETEDIIDREVADNATALLVEGGRRFYDSVLAGLTEAEIDTGNPFEMLLALKRVGARQLVHLFGPGEIDPSAVGGRRALIQACPIREIEQQARHCLDGIGEDDTTAIRAHGFTACVATTDVHEYGKLLLEAVLRQLDVAMIDGGVSTDPGDLVATAVGGHADFVAVSTYNGIALDYLHGLDSEIQERNLSLPIFIGGKLNQIPADSNTSLPVDVSGDLQAAGAIACTRVEDMLTHLAQWAGETMSRENGA